MKEGFKCWNDGCATFVMNRNTGAGLSSPDGSFTNSALKIICRSITVI